MKRKSLVVLLVVQLVFTSSLVQQISTSIISEDDLVVKVNILNVNSTSVSLEYAVVPGDSRDDDQFDIVTNTNDLDLDYRINSLCYTIISNDGEHWSSKTFVNRTRFKDQLLIANLTTSSKYGIAFTLEYDDKSLNVTNQTYTGETLEFYTLDSCNCKLNATISECSNSSSSSKCQCKACYEGASCDRCKDGCFLNHKTQDCEACPCDLFKSSGQCLVTRDYTVKCTDCKLPNVGLLCEECDTYYYKSLKHNNCLPCMCNDNTDPKAKRHCEDSSGECIGCINNTTGMYCDLCLDGYVGNAMNQTCISLNDSLRMAPTEVYRIRMPMDYKGLFMFTLLIFAVLFTILLVVYYCNKSNSNQNEQLSLFHPFNRMLTQLKQRNSKFNGMFTFKRRFTSANSGDDDLNLAENQIFDECLFTDDFYYANQPNNKGEHQTATNNSLLQQAANESPNKTANNLNPYTNLTITA